MTRRILAALLALTGALLGGAVLPLGLETAAHYRRDYADAAIGRARAVASVAEERFADHESQTPVRGDLGKFVADGDRVVLLDAAGATVDREGTAFPVPSTLAAATTATTSSVESGGETLLVVAIPVENGSTRAGVAILARPTEPLETRIHTLWVTLAALAVATGLAVVLLAAWLSRWVAAPLRRLDEAARFVGAGHLDARAGAVHGPPEVRRLAVSFDAMAERLNTLLEGHRAVIADVSHQLRTPMSALRLRLELLAEQMPQDSAQLSGALDELNRLARLVDGLLAVARAEGTTKAPAPIDVRAVTAERVAAWDPLSIERGINLALTPGPQIHGWAVPDHIEQVLDNLLANCFDLASPPQHIRLEVSTSGDTAMITVADDGPGMTVSQRQQAFQRFATNHADTGGTGLGLAIVHRLVTASGGSVSLDETSGGGLTVIVTFPRAPKPRRPPGSPATELRNEPRATRAYDGADG